MEKVSRYLCVSLIAEKHWNSKNKTLSKRNSIFELFMTSFKSRKFFNAVFDFYYTTQNKIVNQRF